MTSCFVFFIAEEYYRSSCTSFDVFFFTITNSFHSFFHFLSYSLFSTTNLNQPKHTPGESLEDSVSIQSSLAVTVPRNATDSLTYLPIKTLILSATGYGSFGKYVTAPRNEPFIVLSWSSTLVTKAVSVKVNHMKLVEKDEEEEGEGEGGENSPESVVGVEGEVGAGVDSMEGGNVSNNVDEVVAIGDQDPDGEGGGGEEGSARQEQEQQLPLKTLNEKNETIRIMQV